MPCYEVRTISLKMDAMSLDVLEAALKRAGFQPFSYGTYLQWHDAWDTYSFRDGRISSQGSQTDLLAMAGRVKQAYAKETVITACEQNAWEWSENSQGQILVERGAW